jgi:hypothetical protein
MRASAFFAAVLVVMPASAQPGTPTLLWTLDTPHPASYGYFGQSVATIGDLDGDGTDDLAVGAPGETSGGALSNGRVYLVSGATGAVLRELAGQPDADGAAQFGEVVAAVGDLDGDGVPDVAASATRSAPAHQRVYLFSGATGAVLGTAESPHPERLGFYGSQMALLGGSGGRLVVEAPGETVGGVANVGRVYVYGRGAVAAEAPPDEPGASLSVSPNPSSGASSVSLTLPSAQAVRVAVVDALGRTLAVAHDGTLSAGRHRLALPAGLAPGVYAVVGAGASARWVVAR